MGIWLTEKEDQKQEKWKQKEPTKDKMADLDPNIPIIMLNLNGPNTSIKRQRLVEEI